MFSLTTISKNEKYFSTVEYFHGCFKISFISHAHLGPAGAGLGGGGGGWGR